MCSFQQASQKIFLSFNPNKRVKGFSHTMSKITVAVLDDDQAMLGLLDRTIRQQGYACETFSNVEVFMAAVRRQQYDLIVIDWVMPQASGLDVVNVLRNELGIKYPIMMVSSRDLERDVAFALYKGIDDYAVKPLRPMEFLARLNKLLGRNIFIEHNAINDFEPYVFDEGLRTVWLKENVIPFAPKDFDLAFYFFQNLNLKLNRQQIYQAVFGDSYLATSRTLDTHAYKIRRDLHLDGRHGFKLNTLYGVGYLLSRVNTPFHVVSRS
jgi:DNA-binding response OmpR family regulator